MIKRIVDSVENVDFNAVKVYENPKGVGYDLSLRIETKDNTILFCDYYQRHLIKCWEQEKVEHALEKFFSHMKKEELEKWYQILV